MKRQYDWRVHTILYIPDANKIQSWSDMLIIIRWSSRCESQFKSTYFRRWKTVRHQTITKVDLDFTLNQIFSVNNQDCKAEDILRLDVDVTWPSEAAIVCSSLPSIGCSQTYDFKVRTINNNIQKMADRNGWPSSFPEASFLRAYRSSEAPNAQVHPQIRRMLSSSVRSNTTSSLFREPKTSTRLPWKPHCSTTLWVQGYFTVAILPGTKFRIRCDDECIGSGLKMNLLRPMQKNKVVFRGLQTLLADTRVNVKCDKQARCTDYVLTISCWQT